MRTIANLIFAVVAGVVAVWMVAGDAIALVVPMPHNKLEIELTRHLQRVHFHHDATGPMWLAWIAVLVIGGLMKRWGKNQLGLGLVAGLICTLPLVPIVKLGWKLLFGADRPGAGMLIGGMLLVIAVLAAKVIVLRMWWRLVQGRTNKAVA